MKNKKALRELKQAAFAYCSDSVSARLSRIRSQIQEIEIALTSETKSSAGDKHETGRAMLQLEREKLGVQLANAERTKEIVSKIKLDSNIHVGLGTMILTEQNNYFMGISAGECNIAGNSIYCISPATPIGKLLLGKSVGDTFRFDQKDIKIIGIV
ncbi:3-oxoacyl-ACP synthase [Maribacter sp. 2304DJ31-5]|uniref:3-oxoacyl-ACP synthase n=1 Tax=Maribacter sp. 2304DJ31-5 TaxID=3386273 RepID=UPI0039BCADB0